MASKLPNGHKLDGSGSTTQTVDSAEDMTTTHLHQNGHGSGHGGGGAAAADHHQQQPRQALVAVPEMCAYCFDVLDGELGGKGAGRRRPVFTDDA